MAVYPQIKYEIKINNVWEDLTPDVIGNQECQYGFVSNSHTERVCTTGTISFVLRNDAGCLGGVEGYYSPNKPNSKPGWKNGIPVRLRILYNSDSFTKFYGHITGIEINSKNRTVNVSVADWMDYTAKHPISLTSIETGKRINEAVQLIIAKMPIKPLNTLYYQGDQVFTTVFDALKEKTKAMTEFSNLALSEFGYIYLKRDKMDGETLVVEGRKTRNTNPHIGQIPTIEGVILLEDDGLLLTENGEKFLIEASTDAILDNSMESIEVTYGNNVINQISAKFNPRWISGLQVLFSLNEPLAIAAGQTETFFANFRDPNSSDKICGKDMIDPVGGTDYLFNSSSNGGGTDLTANLQVTANYGSNGVEYVLKNTGGSGGFVTKLQARGYGIYLYDPVAYTIEDSNSVLENGLINLLLDMKYQNYPTTPKKVADTLLDYEKNPRSVVEAVSFIANTDDHLMNCFLYLDIGDFVHIKDDKTGIDNDFYIHGIKFSIAQGGIIRFTWIVNELINWT